MKGGHKGKHDGHGCGGKGHGWGKGKPHAPAELAEFAPKSVDYYETRADGGFSWDVKYSLGFDDGAFTVVTRVQLTGDAAGDTVRVWEEGIERLWNDRFALVEGSKSYPVRFDVQFVETGGDHQVAVHDGHGLHDVLNWYLDSPWGPDYQDELAAHEFGHMIGAFDEFAGGATQGGYTTSGTLMADLGAGMATAYLHSIDTAAEQFSGHQFDVALLVA